MCRQSSALSLESASADFVFYVEQLMRWRAEVGNTKYDFSVRYEICTYSQLLTKGVFTGKNSRQCEFIPDWLLVVYRVYMRSEEICLFYLVPSPES